MPINDVQSLRFISDLLIILKHDCTFLLFSSNEQTIRPWVDDKFQERRFRGEFFNKMGTLIGMTEAHGGKLILYNHQGFLILDLYKVRTEEK